MTVGILEPPTALHPSNKKLSINRRKKSMFACYVVRRISIEERCPINSWTSFGNQLPAPKDRFIFLPLG
jgi:hypothetical protein